MRLASVAFERKPPAKESFLKGLLTQRGYDLMIFRVEGISATIACHFHGMKEWV
jgi:hypothetical protein